VDVHGARFPGSQRWPEREALAIAALLRLGRAADARARIEAFVSRASAPPGLPGMDSLTEEAAVLGVARVLRRANPEETLRLAELHAARYPGGAQWLERELLAIDALVRMRREADARARAKALRARTSDALRAPGGLALEATLLGAARDALVAEPWWVERAGAEEALWLTDIHAAWFPQGVLWLEREVLALDALAGMGRAADARRRAHASALLARQPHSVYEERIRRHLQGTR
jgi:hypothetical protein